MFDIPPLPETSRLGALLIGIDQYPDIPPHRRLCGSVNDVALMERTLVEAAGFPAHRIEKLLDEQATRSAILAALANLEKTTGPRDVVVVYFSGHGTKVRVRFDDGREQTREGLVPYDRVGHRGASRVIVDLEIRDILQALGRRGREVVLILDTCFAGGNYRSAGGRDRFLPPEHRPPIALHRMAESVGLDWRDPSSRSAWHSESLIFFAACSAGESAKEIDVEGRAYGLFTTRMALALRQAPDGWDYERLQEEVYLAVVECASNQLEHEQRPRLKGSRGRRIFGGVRIDRAPWVSILARNGSRLVLDAGAIDGARPGLIYELAAGAEESPHIFAWCRLEEVTADSAWGRIVHQLACNGACAVDRARDLLGTRCFSTRRGLLKSLRATVQTLTNRAPLLGTLAVDVQRRRGDAGWSQVACDDVGEWSFREGDGLRLVVRNDFREPVFLTILSEGLGEAPELYRIRTLLGLESPLGPGESFDSSQPPELSVDLFFPQAYSGDTGLETYFVLASTRSVPWWFWCLEPDAQRAGPLFGGVHAEDRWGAVELPIRLCR